MKSRGSRRSGKVSGPEKVLKLFADHLATVIDVNPCEGGSEAEGFTNSRGDK